MGSAILFRVRSDVCTPGVLLLLLVLKLVHYSNSSDNQQSISIYKVLPFSFFFSFVTCEAVFVINDSKSGHLIKIKKKNMPVTEYILISVLVFHR